MKILGLEKVSLVDYEEKICATIFTGGCNFFCPFCHNSGIVTSQVEPIEEREVLEYLASRKSLLDAVTISGGEPTLQPDLIEFIAKIKQMGFLVKLDTNGTNPEVLKTLIDKKLVDYVAVDVKNNFDDYLLITGLKQFDFSKVKTSLKLLLESNVDYELRTTLVKEFITQRNIKKMAEELKGHKILYLQKFVDSDSCIKRNLNEIPKEEALKFKNILETKIDKVILRGYN